MTTLPAIGTHVHYRFWESEDFQAGTIVRYWHGCAGTTYADIKRDGYNETAVMPVSKLVNPKLVEVYCPCCQDYRASVCGYAPICQDCSQPDSESR